MSDTDTPSRSVSLDAVRKRPGGRSAKVRERVLGATRQELLEKGYSALSHRAVAARAGVDPATVYRRWPTRPRLASDALLDVAQREVPVPDTGTIAGDLEAFLDAIVMSLRDPSMLRLFHALSAAGGEADADLAETIRQFWEVRFTGAEEMIERAVRRGELPDSVDAHELIEHLVAPAYFRALVTGEDLSENLSRRSVKQTLAAFSGGNFV